jgi:hypothetical protein
VSDRLISDRKKPKKYLTIGMKDDADELQRNSDTMSSYDSDMDPMFCTFHMWLISVSMSL